MLIATHYLLLKNWDIFATRCCILLIFNHNYFRRSQVKTDKNRQKNHKKIRVVARLHGFFCTFAAGN